MGLCEKNLWSTQEVCSYFGVLSSELESWRDEGLNSTMLSGEYYYNYQELVDFLKG